MRKKYRSGHNCCNLDAVHPMHMQHNLNTYLFLAAAIAFWIFAPTYVTALPPPVAKTPDSACQKLEDRTVFERAERTSCAGSTATRVKGQDSPYMKQAWTVIDDSHRVLNVLQTVSLQQHQSFPVHVSCRTSIQNFLSSPLVQSAGLDPFYA